MIALIQFLTICISVIFSRRLFSGLLERNKDDLNKQKALKYQREKEYELKQQQKQSFEKSPYELKKDEIQKMEQEISELKKEAEQYNSTDSYVKYSKMQRQILKLNQTVEKNKLELDNLKMDSVENTSNQQVNISEEDLLWKKEQEELTKNITNLVNNEDGIKKKERFFNGFLPLVFIFIFSNFPVVLNLEIGSTLGLLSGLLGEYQEEFKNYKISNTIWVFICFRVISIIHDYFIKPSQSKITEQQKKNI